MAIYHPYPTSNYCNKKISFSYNFNPLELTSTNVGRICFARFFSENFFFQQKIIFANLFFENLFSPFFSKNIFFGNYFACFFPKKLYFFKKVQPISTRFNLSYQNKIHFNLLRLHPFTTSYLETNP